MDFGDLKNEMTKEESMNLDVRDKGKGKYKKD